MMINGALGIINIQLRKSGNSVMTYQRMYLFYENLIKGQKILETKKTPFC